MYVRTEQDIDNKDITYNGLYFYHTIFSTGERSKNIDTYCVLYIFHQKQSKFGQHSLKIYGSETLTMQKYYHKSFFMLFWYGDKNGIWFSFNKFRTYKNRWRIGHPFWPHTKITHKKLLWYFVCMVSVSDPYISRESWPNFDCIWWEIYRTQYVSMLLLRSSLVNIV